MSAEKYFMILFYNALNFYNTSTYINTHSNFSSEHISELSVVNWRSVVVNISLDEGDVLVWDDFGTCRAVNKHGASTVVFDGDSIRQSEHGQ